MQNNSSTHPAEQPPEVDLSQYVSVEDFRQMQSAHDKAAARLERRAGKRGYHRGYHQCLQDLLYLYDTRVLPIREVITMLEAHTGRLQEWANEPDQREEEINDERLEFAATETGS